MCADQSQLRWYRLAWRPKQLRAGTHEDERTASARTLAEKATAVAELQRKVESGYQELNAERRALGALEEGLQRQVRSLEAIRVESQKLQGELSSLRRRAQEQLAENSQLSGQLALRRQARAEGQTQVALLQAAVQGRAGHDCSKSAELEEQLQACKIRIRSLLEEREMLCG
eukprot:TRINITY_DN7759_c0_g1_i1.p1 TRINITY_DN7759_c0_g1~~TRINITY_DN7759_c0_g1_i1.p1  ORF type:complete len:182 (+),score=47.70 TRINITY_DN7759_c0_g1_i1:33-548(+)